LGSGVGVPFADGLKLEKFHVAAVINIVFEGIEADGEFTFSVRGSGGVPCVEAIDLDLFQGWH
jgi:hypothetical protein